MGAMSIRRLVGLKAMLAFILVLLSNLLCFSNAFFRVLTRSRGTRRESLRVWGSIVGNGSSKEKYNQNSDSRDEQNE